MPFCFIKDLKLQFTNSHILAKIRKLKIVANVQLSIKGFWHQVAKKERKQIWRLWQVFNSVSKVYEIRLQRYRDCSNCSYFLSISTSNLKIRPPPCIVYSVSTPFMKSWGTNFRQRRIEIRFYDNSIYRIIFCYVLI